MIGLAVTGNERRVCLAGIERGALFTLVTLIDVDSWPRDLTLAVRGYNSEKDEHEYWACRGLQVGDRVQIEIVDTDSPDPPRKTSPRKRDIEKPSHRRRSTRRASRRQLQFSY